jgi:DNA-binding HxlR family transcriptional regulator
MEIIGNKWTALILRDLATGSKRFGELEKSLRGSRGATAISPRTLSQRLDDLESHNIITKQNYSDVPPRCEYALTDKGQDLIPILQQMAVWGSKYYREPDSSIDC